MVVFDTVTEQVASACLVTVVPTALYNIAVIVDVSPAEPLIETEYVPVEEIVVVFVDKVTLELLEAQVI